MSICSYIWRISPPMLHRYSRNVYTMIATGLTQCPIEDCKHRPKRVLSFGYVGFLSTIFFTSNTVFAIDDFKIKKIRNKRFVDRLSVNVCAELQLQWISVEDWLFSKRNELVCDETSRRSQYDGNLDAYTELWVYKPSLWGWYCVYDETIMTSAWSIYWYHCLSPITWR